MVSTTLVAAIASGMLWAMRTSLITMEKVDARLDSNRRVMSVEQILSRQLSGVMPVTGNCQNASGGIIQRVPVFNGTDQTLHLVSSYSMSEGARGYARLLELQVVPSDRGGVRLIVNESLYTGAVERRAVLYGTHFRAWSGNAAIVHPGRSAGILSSGLSGIAADDARQSTLAADME